MGKFICRFYLAGAPLRQLRRLTFTADVQRIGVFGQLFSENLILQLGRHYSLYITQGNLPVMNILNTYPGVQVANYTMRREKVKAPAVSGAIGESLVMPALTASLRIPANRLRFHRMTSRSRSPDYRMETNQALFGVLWKRPAGFFAQLPADVPVEVKTQIRPDQLYPPDAYNQLREYWRACLTASPERVGYGIIARVNLLTSTIRYYLFIPDPATTPQNVLNARLRTLRVNPGRYFLQ